MDFIKLEHLDMAVDEASARLKAALQQQGFGHTTELPASAEGARLIIGYANELSAKAISVAPEAPLLLTVTLHLHAADGGTQIGMLDPQVLSLVPSEQGLQPIIDEIRKRVSYALAQIRADAGTEETKETTTDKAAEVEQRLYALILSAIDALSKEDLTKNGDMIFVLSKAYTAVASLSRTEELELHLS